MSLPDVRLPRRAKSPRYVQVAEDLRHLILSSKADAGAPFPTEAELCRKYEVSRFTIREALRQLENEGLIARRRGSGTTLQPAAARGGALLQPLLGIDEMLQYAPGSRITFERLPDGPVPKHLAGEIADDVGGRWLRLSGLRRQQDETPLAFTELFVDPALADYLDHLDPKKVTLFRQLAEQAGLRVDRVTQEIHAVPIPAPLAAQLGMKPRSPALRVIRCYHAGNRLFEIAVSHHPGNRFAYSTRMEVGR